MVVPMTSAPLGSGLDGPPEAHTPSSECHPQRPASRTSPVRREAEEVEGGAPRVVAVVRRPKRETPGLLRVEGEPVLRKPLPEHLPHSLRVLLVLEAQHEVIRVAHQRAAQAKPRLDLALEPDVEHVVQVDVPQ